MILSQLIPNVVVDVDSLRNRLHPHFKKRNKKYKAYIKTLSKNLTIVFTVVSNHGSYNQKGCGVSGKVCTSE